MSNQRLATDLIGRNIEPKYPEHIGKPVGTWPVNEPNASGEHIATITAAWIVDSNVKLLAVTPFGTMFETFAQNVKRST